MWRFGVLLLSMMWVQQEPVPLLHPVTPMPSFSVTSVRPLKPGEEAPGGHTTVDTWNEPHYSVRQAIEYGFGLGYEGELCGTSLRAKQVTSTGAGRVARLRSG